LGKVVKKYGEEVRYSFRKAGPYVNIAYLLIGAIALFGWLGFEFDLHYKTQPIGLIIGLFFGFGLGFYNMVKVLKGI
jgi:F0F1-type ATP synthase assembly protein I